MACADLDDYHPAGFARRFGDEFEGDALDRSAWCTRYAYGGGPAPQRDDDSCRGPTGQAGTLDFLNDEQQRYVDVNRQGRPMHEVGAGTLRLWATKTRDDPYAAYESAMLRSKLTFSPTPEVSYYVTARVRLPSTRGTWPALWLASALDAAGEADWPPEIDIFEGALNGIDDRETMLRMGAQVRGGKQTASGAPEITFSDSFDRTWSNYHAPQSLRARWLEIGALWTATSVCYFVDGARIMCENYRWLNDAGQPATAATLLLNLAVGGAWAGRYGIDDARFPAALEVDHVRIYVGEARSASDL